MCTTFGFNIAFENEWYLHLMSEPGIQIGFMLPDQPTQPDIFKTKFDSNGFILSLEVEDVEQAYAFAKDNSLDIVEDLKLEDWGQYHFVLIDPNSLYVDVIQPFEPTDEHKSG